MSSTFFLVLLILIFIFGYLIHISRPKIIGKRGEATVRMILSRLPESDYHTLNDILLTVSDSGTTVQIDHIVVSTYGVFVIETKCYSGTIYGSENKEYWSQYFRKSEYELRNPIIQNSAHINALRKMFAQYGDLHFFPIVVFSGDAVLKVTTTTPVIYSSQLLHEIKKHTKYHLMPEQRARVIKLLELCNQKSDDNERRHIASVKSKSFLSQRKIDRGICPQCGAKLVTRSGRFGSFIGCSNYPKCRFTMNY